MSAIPLSATPLNLSARSTTGVPTEKRGSRKTTPRDNAVQSARPSTPADSIVSGAVDPSIEKVKAPKLTWSYQTEELLVSWGDIAACYKWLHDQSYRKFHRLNYNFSIPIIVLSTLTGTLNFGMQSFVPEMYMSYAQAGIGAVNIFTGIITTMQNFFRYAQMSESHYNSSVGWSKLQRNISIELKIEQEYRKDADSFVKVQRNEYDRLLEQSPIIPTEIIEMFKSKFKKDINKTGNDKLIVPDICDHITHTSVYRTIQEDKVLPEIKEAFLDAMSSKSENSEDYDDYDPDSNFASAKSSKTLIRKRLKKASERYRNDSEEDSDSLAQRSEYSPEDDLKINIPKIDLGKVEMLYQRRQSEDLKQQIQKPRADSIVKPPVVRKPDASYFSDVMNPDAKPALDPDAPEIKKPIAISKSFQGVGDLIRRFTVGNSIMRRESIEPLKSIVVEKVEEVKEKVEEVKEKVEEVNEKVEEKSEEVKEKSEEVKAEVKEKVEEVKEKVEEVKEKVEEVKVEEVKVEEVEEKVEEEVEEKVEEKVEEVKEEVKVERKEKVKIDIIDI
jgi:hypothetical protein